MSWIGLFMSHNFSQIVAASIALGLFSTFPQTSNAGQIDAGSLLEEMLDRSRIAEFPEPAFVCRQAGSYNRKSREPGTAARFDAPFHAQPVGGANSGVGHTTNTRVRVLDRIPFKSSLTMNMELMHWQSNKNIDYATTTYRYAFDRAESNGHELPEKVSKKVGQISVEHTQKRKENSHET